MKKLLALILVMGAFLMTTGCTNTETPTPKVESQRYAAYGRYYTDGTVITDDGNEWSYTTDTISDKTPTDHMPVWIGFDDNGTADITDDIILGLVYDPNDELETILNIKIQRSDD